MNRNLHIGLTDAPRSGRLCRRQAIYVGCDNHARLLGGKACKPVVDI